MNDIDIQPIYEGDVFSIYRIEEEGGEVGFDVNFYDSVTIHFLKEEWNSFLDVIHSIQPED